MLPRDATSYWWLPCGSARCSYHKVESSMGARGIGTPDQSVGSANQHQVLHFVALKHYSSGCCTATFVLLSLLPAPIGRLLLYRPCYGRNQQGVVAYKDFTDETLRYKHKSNIDLHFPGSSTRFVIPPVDSSSLIGLTDYSTNNSPKPVTPICNSHLD